MEKPEIKHAIENNSFHAYYGPKFKQAHTFMAIADRNKLMACEVFDLCRAAGLLFTEMETWWGIRFPDGTGFTMSKCDLEESRKALAANMKKEK